MVNKKIVEIISALIIAIILLANVPSAAAHVPPTAPGDPAIDPAEIVVANGIWFFNAGHAPGYGSYIRDIQWANGAGIVNRYLGMLSIPYIRINGVVSVFAAVPKALVPVAPPGHLQVVFTYPVIVDALGDFHNIVITFDLHSNPPFSPIGGWADARIQITATDTVTYNSGAAPGGWIFDIPIRADFDIWDIVSPALDDAHIYLPAGGGTWTLQGLEITYGPGAGRVTDPVYGMEILVDDSVVTGNPPGPAAGVPNGPWGGIVPFRLAAGALGPADNFHLVLYNPMPPGPLEYLGPPPPYVNGQAIAPADNVVWDETSLLIAAPAVGGVTAGTIMVDVWIAC